MRIIFFKATLVLAFVLLYMATTMTAWAQNPAISYIDENGVTQTITDYYVPTGSETLDNHGYVYFPGQYRYIVINTNVTYSSPVSFTDVSKLILCDGYTLTVNNKIMCSGDLPIYGQTNNSGKLVVNTSSQYAINGEVNTLTVNGGTVEAKNTHNYGRALLCGALVFNGGNLKLEGSLGVQTNINASRTVTLNWRSTNDRVYISDFYYVNTVNVGGAGGKCFTDGNGNYYGGTYTSDFSAFANKTLQPATACTLALPDGVTATGALFTYNDVEYYAPGTTVTLSDPPTASAGYLDWTYTVNGSAIDGTSFTISENSTVALSHTPDPAHFSQSGDEYTIHTATGWDVFCDMLEKSKKGIFEGKTVKLGADISVTRMAGASGHDFTGTFDGNGKILTFNYTATEQYAAPFRFVEYGCVIKNLHVEGKITTNQKYAAGLIACQCGEVSVSNCHISVEINSNVVGDGTHGGIVALNYSGVLNIDGCVFDGKILGEKTYACGGFVGWANNSVNISNSVFKPSQIGPYFGTEGDNSQTFSRNETKATISNCYYFATLHGIQGKAAHTVTAGDNVEISFGTPTAYDVKVSGIKAYSTGIEYDGKFYAGEGDEVSLTLNADREGYTFQGYTASAGTLSGDANLYTLTMPDENVTISAAWLRLPYVTVNVTGSGTVTYGEQNATDGNPFDVTTEKGASVVLTLAPTDGNAVRSVEYGYTNNSGTTASGRKLPVSGTTATLTVPDDLKDGTGVTVTVTFAPALNGGADEASAVALTDATVTDLGGGWYKVENDITFDHTLNLLADTYLTIAEGKTMTVNTASGKAIDSEYTLNVSGAGALNITTAGAYTIAVRVGSYVQTGATVTASGYIGIRCIDNFKGFNVTNDFTFSGGQLTATGSASDGIWADNDISLSCTNATDFIYASSYSSIYGAVKIAEGKALTDGINTYENTISSSTLKALTNVKLQPVTKTINFDSKGGSEVDAQTIVFGSVANEPDAPTRDGYTFDGWYLTGSQYDFSTAVTDDITLMAVWKKVNGALTLTEYGDRTTATINGNYTADDALLTLAEEIAVTSVTFDRTFTPGATSTIILPFTVESGNYEGGTFYEFTSVDYKNDKWVASLTKVAGNIEAHKPYLYMPSDDKLTIKSGVKFTATSAEEYTDTKGDWTFKGVFKKKDWETGVRTDYFFASTSATSTEGNAVNAGDFVRIGNKCHLSPFRCYLSYSVSGSEQSLLKSAKELPLSIEVRLIDEVASVVEPDDNPSESGEVITPVSEITPNSGIKVWSFDGTIFIEAQPNMDYTIVDLNGRTLKNGVTNSTREEVTLNRAAGIVIVKIGNKTFKVQY